VLVQAIRRLERMLEQARGESDGRPPEEIRSPEPGPDE
jgi:hypothetical protein